jgi:hypothetical protein
MEQTMITPKWELCPTCHNALNQLEYDMQFHKACGWDSLGLLSKTNAPTTTSNNGEAAMDAKVNPIRTALGDNYDGLTSLQQALVDFAENMHTRLKENGASDDAGILVDDNNDNGMRNISRLLSNVYQLVKAEATEVYNPTAAADTANLALILDLTHANRFTA